MDFNIKHILSIILYFHIQFIELNSAADDDMNFDFHYDRVESFNGTDQYFKYQGSITKEDKTKNIFKVDATFELLQDLDNDWQISAGVFKLDEKNEYQPHIIMPKMNICSYMKTIYKKYFYDEISKYSNLPHYDTCPVTKGQYEIKEYPFDMKTFKQFKSLIEPGTYRVQLFLINNDVAVSGVLFYGSVTKKV